MRKIVLLLWLSIVAVANIEAQQIKADIQKSDIFEDKFKASNILLAEPEKDDIILVRAYKGGFTNAKGYNIERYDSNMKLLKDYDLAAKSSNVQKYSITVGCLKMGSRVVLIEMWYDLNEKAYLCNSTTIDVRDFKTESKELFRITKNQLKNGGNFSLEKMYYDQMEFFWRKNPEGTFFGKRPGEEEPIVFSEFFSSKMTEFQATSTSGIALVVNPQKNAFALALDFDAEDKEKVKFYVFDSTCNKTKELDFNREVEDKKYIFQNLCLSDSGQEIFVAAKVFGKKRKGEVNYQYEIVKLDDSEEQRMFIDTREHFVGSIKMIAESNKLFCLGLYSDTSDIKYKGLAFFGIDISKMSLEKQSFEIFSDQFFADKYGESRKKEVKFLMPKEVLRTANGDFIFNSEEYFLTTSQNRIYYNYNDIVSIRLNDSGKILWSRNINKYQSALQPEDEAFVSYSSVFNNDTVYFFVNTANKVKTISADRIEFGAAGKSRSDVTIIQIQPNGIFGYKELLDRKENEVPFMVAKGLKNGNAIYFLGRKGKDKQLLKITL